MIAWKLFVSCALIALVSSHIRLERNDKPAPTLDAYLVVIWAASLAGAIVCGLWGIWA